MRELSSRLRMGSLASPVHNGSLVSRQGKFKRPYTSRLRATQDVKMLPYDTLLHLIRKLTLKLQIGSLPNRVQTSDPPSFQNKCTEHGIPRFMCFLNLESLPQAIAQRSRLKSSLESDSNSLRIFVPTKCTSLRPDHNLTYHHRLDLACIWSLQTILTAV